VLAPFELAEKDETNFIRQFHSALHGFVALEGAGFFRNADVTVDETFASLVECQIATITKFKGKGAE
jgi:hypothetical protein